MVSFSASQYFVNTDLLPWFWILAALVLLYLIKPKPQQQTIPSLMFLLQDKGKAFKNSFLRYLYRDFVFFLQLLILALLVGAACRPFLEVEKTSFVGNSVIILDVSASMQTDDGRWEQAKQAAFDALASQNTLILVANRPIVYAKEVSRGEAEDALRNLKPFDTDTNLYAAVSAAKDYAPDADSIITIISDFRNTDSQQNWQAAAKIVQASGALIKVVQVGGQAENVGITSLDVQEEKTRIGITNHMTQATAVILKAGGFSQSVPLLAGGTDYLTINTPAGITEITIDSDDDLELDNKAYIANNPDLSVRILFITNNQQIRATPLWFALQAIHEKTSLDLTVEVSNPPQLANLEGYDVVIFADVDQRLIVQRTIREAADYVRAGGAVVITHQDDLFSINYEDLLPLTYKSTAETSAILTAPSPITQDVEFGDTQEYFVVEGKGVALAQTTDSSPIVSLIPLGRGSVLYYGISDEKSSFPFEPSYPVFWKRSLDQLTGKASLERLNYNTGVPPLISTSPKETPVDDYQGFLDKQGLYEFSDHTVAANLLSSEESRVSTEAIEDLSDITGDANVEQKKQKELDTILILAALILLALELFIVKFRGDF